MSTQNTLYIVNYFPTALDLTVTYGNYDCCELPQPGHVGSAGQYQRLAVPYVRSDWQGCDGKQGTFQFEAVVGGTSYWIGMDFDSHGSIEITSPLPTNIGVYLAHNNDGTFSLALGPAAN